MSGSSDARVRLALARGGVRALQDAALSLWRASGQLCRTRLGVLQAVLVAVAAEPHCDRAVSACAFRLCAVQGAGVALVALRSPLRRRTARLEAAQHGFLRAVLEGDRLVHAADD